MKQVLLYILCLMPMVIAMEPPSEKKRKQEITKDIVPTPAKKTKITQAIEGDFKLFVELPEEMQEYILFETADTLEEATNRIQKMMQTNKKWRDNINDNVDYIIALLAKRFQVTELLAAFYLGTQAAEALIAQRFHAHNNNMRILLDYSLDEAIKLFNNSAKSKAVIQKIVDRNGNFAQGAIRLKDGSIVYERNLIIKKIMPDGSDDINFKEIKLPDTVKFVKQIIIDNKDYLIVLSEKNPKGSLVSKYFNTGELDSKFGVNGTIDSTDFAFQSLELTDNQEIISVGLMLKTNTWGIIRKYSSNGNTILSEVAPFGEHRSFFTTLKKVSPHTFLILGFFANENIQGEEANVDTILFGACDQNLILNKNFGEQGFKKVPMKSKIITNLIDIQPQGTLVISGSSITDVVNLFIKRFKENLDPLDTFETQSNIDEVDEDDDEDDEDNDEQ